jgi:hypothetical protein
MKVLIFLSSLVLWSTISIAQVKVDDGFFTDNKISKKNILICINANNCLSGLGNIKALIGTIKDEGLSPKFLIYGIYEREKEYFLSEKLNLSISADDIIINDSVYKTLESGDHGHFYLRYKNKNWEVLSF